MSAVTLKAAALAILGDSGANWTRGALARTSTDKPCSPLNPSAVKFDVMGALIVAQKNSSEPDLSSYHAVYNLLRSKIPVDRRNRDIEAYNDATDWAGISALFA